MAAVFKLIRTSSPRVGSIERDRDVVPVNQSTQKTLLFLPCTLIAVFAFRSEVAVRGEADEGKNSETVPIFRLISDYDWCYFQASTDTR